MVVVILGRLGPLKQWVVCACRQSDAQVNKRAKWGFRVEWNRINGDYIKSHYIVCVCVCVTCKHCCRAHNYG